MSEKVLMKGNEAIAEAAILCGCKHFFGYPITPQNEIPEYFANKMPAAGGVAVQAESEIGAINMVLGASAAGVRVLTSSCSPGISLKTEAISYLIGSDLPCVIVNVQRSGPGLGGIQPSQADYFQTTRALGHGDVRAIVLAPASVQEAADYTRLAFDLADVYRMPVMILSDGALGQMMEPVEFKKGSGRTLPAKTWATCGHQGKREQNIITSLYIDPYDLEKTVVARYERYAEIQKKEVMFEEIGTEDADVVVVAYGISARVARSAVRKARKAGIKAGLFRPQTLWPFPTNRLNELAGKIKKYVVAELNMGQMVEDVRLAADAKCGVDFVGRTGGVVITPDEIFEAIKKAGGK